LAESKTLIKSFGFFATRFKMGESGVMRIAARAKPFFPPPVIAIAVASLQPQANFASVVKEGLSPTDKWLGERG